MRWSSIVSQVIAIVAASWLPQVWAGEFWVDRDSIGGPCADHRERSEITRSTPWCTLGKAANNVRPGDIVHIRGGEYTDVHRGHPRSWEQAVLQIVVSGTPEAPILFAGEPGESVVLSGSGGAVYGVLVAGDPEFQPRHIEVANVQVRGFHQVGVMIEGTGDVILKNIEVTECRWGAIGTQHAARVTIEDCMIHHNALEGWISAISLWACGEGNIVRGNAIWRNTDEDARETEGHGIILDYCEDRGGAVVEDNVIWDNEGWCIHVFHASNATVRDNTCIGNGLGRGRDTGELSILGNDLDVAGNVVFPRSGRPAFDVQTGTRGDPPASYGFNIWFPGAGSTDEDRTGRLEGWTTSLREALDGFSFGGPPSVTATPDLFAIVDELQGSVGGLENRSESDGAAGMLAFHQKMDRMLVDFRDAAEDQVHSFLTAGLESTPLSQKSAHIISQGVVYLALFRIDEDQVEFEAPSDRVQDLINDVFDQESPGDRSRRIPSVEKLASRVSALKIRLDRPKGSQ